MKAQGTVSQKCATFCKTMFSMWLDVMERENRCRYISQSGKHNPVLIYRFSRTNTLQTHTHTCLTALFPGLPGEPVPERQNQYGFYWSIRQWVAVASAGPYASLHLAPDRLPRQHPTTHFLQAGCPSCCPTNSVKALKAMAPCIF